MTPERVKRIYLTLLLLQTLATSLIWGINTLFLLDARLSITEAFVANAAFTFGMTLFEVPTGVIADSVGRRESFLLGAVTLLLTTAAYLGLWHWQAGVVWWILVSALIGLGFTFFSGATEAWLVDALEATGFKGPIEHVFGRGQTVTGAATLIGTVAGGFLAQISFGVPYLLRSVLLLAVIAAAWRWMHDIGYSPAPRESVSHAVREILRASVRHGLGNPPVRMFMLAAPFASGVGVWVYYAFQPYLLELFGDPDAVYLSGIAAAIFAIAQMVGGASVGWARERLKTRTGLVFAQVSFSVFALAAVGAASWLVVPAGFWVAMLVLALHALGSAIAGPVERAYVNHLIPSQQRATVLSFYSLMGNAGGVVSQPVLGRVADVYSFGFAYLVAGALYGFQLPFIWLARRMKSPADVISPSARTDLA